MKRQLLLACLLLVPLAVFGQAKKSKKMFDCSMRRIMGNYSQEMKCFSGFFRLLHGPEKSFVAEKASFLNSLIDFHPIKEDPPSSSQVKVASLRISNSVSGHAHSLT